MKVLEPQRQATSASVLAIERYTLEGDSDTGSVLCSTKPGPASVAAIGSRAQRVCFVDISSRIQQTLPARHLESENNKALKSSFTHKVGGREAEERQERDGTTIVSERRDC
jgi:hypothetical protein